MRLSVANGVTLLYLGMDNWEWFINWITVGSAAGKKIADHAEIERLGSIRNFSRAKTFFTFFPAPNSAVGLCEGENIKRAEVGIWTGMNFCKSNRRFGTVRCVANGGGKEAL